MIPHAITRTRVELLGLSNLDVSVVIKQSFIVARILFFAKETEPFIFKRILCKRSVIIMHFHDTGIFHRPQWTHFHWVKWEDANLSDRGNLINSLISLCEGFLRILIWRRIYFSIFQNECFKMNFALHFNFLGGIK